ncbi:MAG: inositol monophosphatase [Pseudomonadota bacterium]
MLADDQKDAIISAVQDVAAAEIMPRFRALDATEVEAKSAFDDLVTVADRASETALTARIRGILPDAMIVGEEAVSADASVLDGVTAAQCVVIDPIDGTWNFAHGIANFGVIVAMLEAGETVWGLLYDPVLDDWIVASRGDGAWFHSKTVHRRLSVSQATASFDKLRGSVSDYLYPEHLRTPLAATTPRFRKSASLGASLHEYRLLASGGSDFVLNGMLNVWDHAAGVLVLEESGGVARLLDGTPYAPTLREGRLLSARSDRLWCDLADLFNKAVEGAAPLPN